MIVAHRELVKAMLMRMLMAVLLRENAPYKNPTVDWNK